MQSLYTITTGNNIYKDSLTKGEKFSIFYHNIFDYPLNFYEISRWQAGERKVPRGANLINICGRNGYWFMEGKDGLIYKRILRQRISSRKRKIAERASKFLSLIPSIKMIAVTGSLAMENSDEDGDIDLMVITKKGTLWLTRLLSYIILSTVHFSLRRPNDRVQKDRLCLNLWLDESDLVWDKNKRNFYTAHEIAQIIPLVDKYETYNRFLIANKWILSFWPKSVRIREKGEQKEANTTFLSLLLNPFERLAYQLQLIYMRRKITREVVSPTRAIFHPYDWGKLISRRLSLRSLLPM